jgi:hypothetical protein
MFGLVERVEAENTFAVSGTVGTFFWDADLLDEILAGQEAMREFAKAVRAPPTMTAIARFMS